MISRRFQPRWSRWVNLDLRKLWVDPPTIPIQSNVLRKNWSTDCVEIGFSPLLNFVFFESVKNTWSSVVSSCCLIHDWSPSITLGWIGTILDSFVLVDDFSIVSVPSTKFRFRTLMVVISLTRPAEKYISSARSEYLIGRLEQNDSIWSSVRQADLPDRFILHIGHQREGRWTGDRVLLDDQPRSTTMIVDLLSKRPSIKSIYDSILFVGVCRWSFWRSGSIQIWTKITIWFDWWTGVLYMNLIREVMLSTPSLPIWFGQNRSNHQPTCRPRSSHVGSETDLEFNRLNFPECPYRYKNWSDRLENLESFGGQTDSILWIRNR